ncbi:hypothetical protein [Shewanella sp.]|uniref:hypothetical protein n=1 Tax=Shewanella sp. TaxID=50422 RepID=UPI003D1429F8
MQHKHDAQHEQLMNMKQLRLELRQWANWWLRHEYGQGYASRSACDKIKEPLIHDVSVIELDIQPPRYVVRYDLKVEKLSMDCRRAIRAHYFCRGNWALAGFDSRKTFLFWLRRAELVLV